MKFWLSFCKPHSVFSYDHFLLLFDPKSLWKGLASLRENPSEKSALSGESRWSAYRPKCREPQSFDALLLSYSEASQESRVDSQSESEWHALVFRFSLWLDADCRRIWPQRPVLVFYTWLAVDYYLSLYYKSSSTVNFRSPAVNANEMALWKLSPSGWVCYNAARCLPGYQCHTLTQQVGVP